MLKISYKDVSGKKYSKFAMIILLVFIANIFSQTYAADIVFEDTFENDPAGSPPNSDHKRKINNWGSCSGNCTQITREYSRSGKQALKTYLNRIKSRVSYRTEAVPRGEARSRPELGDHWWYGFSVLVPNSIVPDLVANDIVAQWHGEAGRNPPVALFLTGNQLKMIVRYDENGRQRSKAFSLGTHNPGSWMDFVFHFKWSAKRDGLTEVWKDGKKVVSYSGANAYDESHAPWMKIGLYKSPWRNVCSSGTCYDVNIVERTFYHDEFRIARGADGYSDVDPSRSGGGNDSLPPPSNLRIISSN